MNQKQTYLGIELGSTRIKGVLIDENHKIIASGASEWESRLIDGIWTYSIDAVHNGLRECWRNLADDFEKSFKEPLCEIGSIGISGMMHGYLAFDADGELLVPFRTWRNRITGEATDRLTELFGTNIPQRWSIAHLYQAMLNGEEHLARLSHLTTLAGYIHYRLTGRHAVGFCEASGMFPIDTANKCYDEACVSKFDAVIREMGYSWDIRQLLPEVLAAGDFAGSLTEDGAYFLDPTGTLRAGIPTVPPEGDAGTGMTATNAVRMFTGNVSAGTSVFAMIVTDCVHGIHREIDSVTTPSGLPVAMVHCNNCTSDINAWAELFMDLLERMGSDSDKNKLYQTMFSAALEGDADCGGMMAYNYYSGEAITGLTQGCPVFLRRPESPMGLGNFMRTHLMSALATLKLGMDSLMRDGSLRIDRLCGHGGFFRVPGVGQRLLSAAVGVPVTVMDSADNGGAYGMALLAAYGVVRDEKETLEDYLDRKVFADVDSTTLMADSAEITGFTRFADTYRRTLSVETAAVQNFCL